MKTLEEHELDTLAYVAVKKYIEWINMWRDKNIAAGIEDEDSFKYTPENSFYGEYGKVEVLGVIDSDVYHPARDMTIYAYDGDDGGPSVLRASFSRMDEKDTWDLEFLWVYFEGHSVIFSSDEGLWKEQYESEEHKARYAYIAGGNP